MILRPSGRSSSRWFRLLVSCARYVCARVGSFGIRLARSNCRVFGGPAQCLVGRWPLWRFRFRPSTSPTSAHVRICREHFAKHSMIRLCTCLELDADDCGECGPWTRAAPNGVGAAAVLVEPRGRSWEPLRGRATGFHLPSASVDASSGRRTRETMQNKGISETDHWNFRISREQQHWTQSLLTVRGPLQQDVAVQEAPMPFRESAGHDVPSKSLGGGAIGFL